MIARKMFFAMAMFACGGMSLAGEVNEKTIGEFFRNIEGKWELKTDAKEEFREYEIQKEGNLLMLGETIIGGFSAILSDLYTFKNGKLFRGTKGKIETLVLESTPTVLEYAQPSGETISLMRCEVNGDALKLRIILLKDNKITEVSTNILKKLKQM